jgi:hypothetical protein
MSRMRQHVSQQQPNQFRYRAAFAVGADGEHAAFIFGETARNRPVVNRTRTGACESDAVGISQPGSASDLMSRQQPANRRADETENPSRLPVRTAPMTNQRWQVVLEQHETEQVRHGDEGDGHDQRPHVRHPRPRSPWSRWLDAQPVYEPTRKAFGFLDARCVHISKKRPTRSLMTPRVLFP